MFYVLISHIFYSSRNHCLVFSHSEDSSGYSACDTKYGDISESTFMNETFLPWYSVRSSITDVNIENKIKPTSTKNWFYDFNNLVNINTSNIKTSNVTSMIFMFYNCRKLTSLDLSSFDTSKVTAMYGLVRNCTSLTSLNVSNFNTSSVTDMRFMFDGCTKLPSLDLSSFNTSKVTTMRSMFENCYQLTSINYGPNFVNSSLTDSTNMFENSPAKWDATLQPSWYQ